MFRIYRTMTDWWLIGFCATAGNSIFELMIAASGWHLDRTARALSPGFPHDEPQPQTVQPIPTDVPVKEPHDVPAPQPHDVPPPEPGTDPKPSKDSKGPKPRPVP